MTIKERLDTEAQSLAKRAQESGQDVNELAAKHATERQYGQRMVKSLVAALNRQQFKLARAGRQADIVIADADRIWHLMRRPEPGQATKVASTSSVGFVVSRLDNLAAEGSKANLSVEPLLRAKLAAACRGLGSQIKQARSEIRRDVEELVRYAIQIKRSGLDLVDRFHADLSSLPEGARELVKSAVESVDARRECLTDGQLRMVLPAALCVTTKVAALAKRVWERQRELGELQAQYDQGAEFLASPGKER